MYKSASTLIPYPLMQPWPAHTCFDISSSFNHSIPPVKLTGCNGAISGHRSLQHKAMCTHTVASRQHCIQRTQ